VDGELVEQDMGAQSSWIAGEILRTVGNFCSRHNLGWVFNADCGYQCFPDARDKVRRPDVSFIARGRLPEDRIPDGHVPVPPDLAVEVVSPHDRFYEVERKVGEYLRAGVRLVWVVNPHERTVQVYRHDDSVSRLSETGELDGEGVLPGFRCPVRELFPPQAQATPAE
ncbi:MAG TPA: Uma2 family endonuclease, partial [Armatimonadota bacterium]|nr:Uma2 family endonuclease [Armatimonadota bacterium]